jgi:hypothetical protein
VSGHGDRRAAGGNDLGSAGLARLRVTRIERHRRPRLGERGGDGQPDAPAASGDQRDAPVQGEALGDTHAQLRLEVPA